jgi:hypothetical protein
LWEWSVGGERTLLRATFSNSSDAGLRQSYPDSYPYSLNAGGTGAAERVAPLVPDHAKHLLVQRRGKGMDGPCPRRGHPDCNHHPAQGH